MVYSKARSSMIVLKFKFIVYNKPKGGDNNEK